MAPLLNPSQIALNYIQDVKYTMAVPSYWTDQNLDDLIRQGKTLIQELEERGDSLEVLEAVEGVARLARALERVKRSREIRRNGTG